MSRKSKASHPVTLRQALALRENDPHVLNDLGWTLVLAGHHDEARRVLTRAVLRAPKGYDLPSKNLEELDRRMVAAGKGGGRTA